jgi:hypothetical protein
LLRERVLLRQSFPFLLRERRERSHFGDSAYGSRQRAQSRSRPRLAAQPARESSRTHWKQRASRSDAGSDGRLGPRTTHGVEREPRTRQRLSGSGSSSCWRSDLTRTLEPGRDRRRSERIPPLSPRKSSQQVEGLPLYAITCDFDWRGRWTSRQYDDLTNPGMDLRFSPAHSHFSDACVPRGLRTFAHGIQAVGAASS